LKNKNEYLKFLLLGCCIISAVYFFPAIIPEKLSSAINDLPSWYVYVLSRNTVKPLKIVGIEIDEHSLNKIASRWPWKRAAYATLIKILDREGANTVGIDFVFAGESEVKDDDQILKSALNEASCGVVLAYLFDYKKGYPVLPLSGAKDARYYSGIVNTPQDSDSKVRRLRSYITLGEQTYYSFSVMLASSFLKRSPEELAAAMPLAKDKTFLVSYLLKEKDISRMSFYDVLENLEFLKQKYGSSFLKDSLVLVYPSAAIFHDKYLTPIAEMTGGLLHLNGTADIITGRFMRQVEFLAPALLIFSLLIIARILIQSGFLSGTLFTLGVFLVNFWLVVLLNLKGLQVSYSRVVIFGLLFFITGSLYKYLSFLNRLLKIKDKVTIDPLRNIFTLRYFCYRLELELKKIYLRRNFYLVFISLGLFSDSTEEVSLESVKEIWRRINSRLSLKRSFWAAYTQDELAGCILEAPLKIDTLLSCLHSNLAALFKEKGITCGIKIAYLKLKKEYNVRELLFILSSELKSRGEGLILLKDGDLGNLLNTPSLKGRAMKQLLDSLGEDIDDKNRQLLLLIENLRKEHARTKEAFFEIITSLVNALEARDSYTQGHSQRVADYALRLADKLGWNREEKEKLKKAALLHDLGKIGIPDNILHKRTELTGQEYDFIKRHEIIAVKILEPLKDLKEILPWILYHHERWDGKGYPQGLAADAIPLASQILSIADVYDALSTGRDYKQAYSLDYSLEELLKNRGGYFNPWLVDIFVGMMRKDQPKNDLHLK